MQRGSRKRRGGVGEDGVLLSFDQLLAEGVTKRARKDCHQLMF